MAEHFRAEYIKCGKKGCKSCPHGPYWYGYQRIKGKLHKKYYGKVDPRDKAREREKRPNHPHDDIFLKSKATLNMAYHILGIGGGMMLQDIKKHFRQLSMKHHPDRGGDEQVYKRIVAAWSYIQSMFKD
jgi:DnaJ domain